MRPRSRHLRPSAASLIGGRRHAPAGSPAPHPDRDDARLSNARDGTGAGPDGGRSRGPLQGATSIQESLNTMRPGIDYGRRHFLKNAAMTIGAARAALVVEANQRTPPELAAIGHATEWINSPRLTSATLAGKVVLVDFWTYTCINWLRTLPYVRGWAQKYRQGLVVIGVHTPEFPFEHNVDNVRRAVQQMRIEYPIVIDNDYTIWRAFGNQYW